ncbi:P-loop containing nucleoside triphosphate hydrolase protein [Lasiosphaeria hispida]|uniref:P-loop containing nucleoside triphosphate hydrolase protein n=1 Tax=Lasiosphaeria hispida TaxID=260671 RepID=A0AAJ0MC91_9PEZI|nr:P-loop containing nucleoside triphosphate hydrolase protein [Lasiosphaeria hispida]
MAVFRQTWTLASKNFLIVLGRHGLATVFRAFISPIVLMALLSFARNLFVPPAIFGISEPHGVRSLSNALAASAGTGRETVAFVNSGFTGGEIDRVIADLSAVVTSAGKTATVLRNEIDLTTTCRATLRGVTPCFGAVVFRGSPSEGNGGLWNYTLRADGALGNGVINVNKDTNDAQIYMLPLQRAVDVAITASNNGTNNQNPLPAEVDEYPFTSLTTEERAVRVRVIYTSMVMNFLGVAFIVGIIGIVYHLTGFIASERETGMSTLIEAMMSTNHQWEAQAARIMSYHLSFSLIYLPGWVIGSLILWGSVFRSSSPLILLFYHILSGLALASMSIFGAAFFKKSQLSGVAVTMTYVLLAIVAQTLTAPKTGAVAALSLLFAPCNYTFFISLLARWEQEQIQTNLLQTAPNSPWSLPGIVLMIFLVIQIIVYPILGALLERYFHGTTSSTRNIVTSDNRGDLAPDAAVQLEGFTKIYSPGFIRRLFSSVKPTRPDVVAVDKLTLTAGRGQILVLLGANGSGKSTTLDSIAGINKLTSGRITIDGTGGMGIAPQKNVLWDELTVEEHVRIFNRLKSPNNLATKEEIRALVVSVDLEQKIKAQSKTLSGGQKRKVQLGMMLTGGSAVCCVDEVSSGLDPLSRRKIWDILLAERGRRTIIMTTHFLDEADLLADHIAIMSKGSLRAEGTSVELKDRMGGGYRIHINNAKHVKHLPDIAGVNKRIRFEEAAYIASSSALAAQVIRELEAAGISDYRFSGPTIEDVFLQLAEEVRTEDGKAVLGPRAIEKQGSSDPHAGTDDEAKSPGLELMSGQRIGYFKQTWVLFLKRCVIFKHNWIPYAAAFLIPIVAAGLVTLFVNDQDPVGCDPAQQSSRKVAVNIFDGLNLFLVGGPNDQFTESNLVRLFAPIYLASAGGAGGAGGGSGGGGGGPGGGPGGGSALAATNPLDIFNNLTFVNSLGDFSSQVELLRKNVTPAAIWLGDANSRPTVAYKGAIGEMFSAWFGQYVMDMLLTNTTIASSFVNFDTPFAPDTGESLQLLVYISLAFCAYPAFFALYPNLERRRNVRGLQYSNGVRPMPLWLAHTAFDFSIVLVSTIIVVGLLAGLARLWYHVGYLFIVFLLYGLASILLAYNVSLVSNNQLSAYAFTAGGQIAMFIVYLIAYMCVITYVPINKIDNTLLVVHFVISAFSPIGSIARTLFLALNLFSTACDGEQLASNPGGINQYGGPILYLILQSILLFSLLVWFDGGDAGASIKRLFTRSRPAPSRAEDEAAAISDEEVAHELVRVKSSATGPQKSTATTTALATPETDGLRVVNLTKTFGSNTAVDNVTFGVPHGEVFALLGPNGAGKSTTISVVRGDLKPDARSGGDVWVEDASVTRKLAAARANLGVCPQFDAIDQMTVAEHLRFYARVRGVPGVEHNVGAVLRAVGLDAFRDRQALALSGGNKRKLSLGIALMGNPTVVLLDEPSSGLDAAAKRIMWRTLAETAPGRSILLTTHSMEEADALANRAGILAKRMLAMGSIEQLRGRFGDALHVHLVCRGAPRSADADVERVRRWVRKTWPAAEVEDKTYHGQMRFSVPAAAVSQSTEEISSASARGASAIGRLVVLLEENRAALGIEHFSVSPTTLDQVFLTVVGKHNVREEGYETHAATAAGGRGRGRDRKGWWRLSK